MFGGQSLGPRHDYSPKTPSPLQETKTGKGGKGRTASLPARQSPQGSSSPASLAEGAHRPPIDTDERPLSIGRHELLEKEAQKAGKPMRMDAPLGHAGLDGFIGSLKLRIAIDEREAAGRRLDKAEKLTRIPLISSLPPAKSHFENTRQAYLQALDKERDAEDMLAGRRKFNHDASIGDPRLDNFIATLKMQSASDDREEANRRMSRAEKNTKIPLISSLPGLKSVLNRTFDRAQLDYWRALDKEGDAAEVLAETNQALTRLRTPPSH